MVVVVVVVEHEDETNDRHWDDNEGESEEEETEGSTDDITRLVLSTSSSEELSIELLSMNPESLSSSSSMKSSCSSSMDSSSESVKTLVESTCTQSEEVVSNEVVESLCSWQSNSLVETSLVLLSTEVEVSSHSRAGVEAWAWVRAGWCKTSSAQRAWGGDVQITLAGTASAPSSPDHRRLPLARGSPIVECPLFCTDISAHMMLKVSV